MTKPARLERVGAKLGGRAATTRLLALALLLAAPFAPAIERGRDRQTVMFVVDRSLSISDDDRRAADDLVAAARAVAARDARLDVGVVIVDRRPRVALWPGDDDARLSVASEDAEPGRGTDLAGAVRLAASALPEAGRRRIVIVSDGRTTHGDLRAEVELARRRGVTVDTMPLGARGRARPAVATLDLARPRVAEGEPVEATAALRGRPGDAVEVAWTRDGAELAREVVTFDDQGRALSRVSDRDAPRGTHLYRARIAAEGDEAASSAIERGHALAVVTGRPRVLVLTSTGERPTLLLDALEDADAEVVHRSLDQGQPTAALLAETDLVVLADVAIARRGEVTVLAGLTDEGQRQLVEYVSERGGGLLVLGGVFGFGPEYAGQPIARALPVEVEDLGELEDPSVAMAIQLDRSGSMSASVGGHTKLELAIEAALAAAGSLRTYDRVAIGSVDEATTWFQPLGYLSELVRRREYIRSMAPGGGGIFVYTALTDAYSVLQSAPEPIRHVVLFSDTDDSEEQYEGCPFDPCDPGMPSAISLARTARRAGITTSVVGIGSGYDRDTTFLRNLARAGGGRFYVTRRATDLRRIFVSETRAATRSSLREDRLELHAGDAHPILEGVDVDSMPPIEGFVQTARRATADTALVTEEGRPVLASWRFGLGTVVAWTSDGGQRWAGTWASWDGAGQLMRQMARFAMRHGGGHGVEARLALRDGVIEVEIESPGETGGRSPERLALRRIDATGASFALDAPLEQVAPGRWVAHARLGGDEREALFAVATVLDDEGRPLTEAVAAHERALELRGDGADERLLRDLASIGGGVYAPDAAAALRPDGPVGREPVATWPLLLVLAALLVCADLWLRRLARGKRRVLADLGLPAEAEETERRGSRPGGVEAPAVAPS